MTDRLFAYLMDELSPAERAEVERLLADNPRWQSELERLRHCLEDPACEDVAAEELSQAMPSRDLVIRTCCLVEESGDDLQLALPDQSCPPSSGGWSAADLLVGAGVLCVLASLVLPAVQQHREQARQEACRDNLRFVGTALADFAERHRHLPHIQPWQNAGRFAVILADRGGIDRDVLAARLICPASQLADRVASGCIKWTIPQRSQLATLQGRELLEALKLMSGSYAFSGGYFDERHNYHPVSFTARGYTPMLGDAHSFATTGFRSANHGGCGQNILFQDLSTRHYQECVAPAAPCENRAVTIDNFYFNRNGQHAAGLDATDAVLLRSEYGPNGSTFRLAQ
jgi:type II secretory pathway pseudopilin PulG